MLIHCVALVFGAVPVAKRVVFKVCLRGGLKILGSAPLSKHAARLSQSHDYKICFDLLFVLVTKLPLLICAHQHVTFSQRTLPPVTLQNLVGHNSRSAIFSCSSETDIQMQATSFNAYLASSDTLSDDPRQRSTPSSL